MLRLSLEYKFVQCDIIRIHECRMPYQNVTVITIHSLTLVREPITSNFSAVSNDTKVYFIRESAKVV